MYRMGYNHLNNKNCNNKINLIVGAGFSGAALAYLLAEELGQKVVVIDKKSHIAGNCYDYKDKHGITIHKYGSHIFHTEHEKVWKFISKFTDFNQYVHKVYALIDGVETTIPFNLNSLYDVFPKTLATRLEEKLLKNFEYGTKVPILEFQKQDDDDLKFLANYVYEKVFLRYTSKQWGLDPKNIDSAVTARVPVFISKDDRYFQDKYQGIPSGGYTSAVEKMLKHPNIEICLNTDFKEVEPKAFDRIFYTGAIDEYFDYCLGELPYRSIELKLEELPVEYAQDNAVVNYPCNYDFTRIHEYKYYLNEKSGSTVIAKEYPMPFENGKNERFYPIPKAENLELYNKYLNEAKELKNVYFLGRLGDYKYYNMDQAILRAMELFEALALNDNGGVNG